MVHHMVTEETLHDGVRDVIVAKTQYMCLEPLITVMNQSEHITAQVLTPQGVYGSDSEDVVVEIDKSI
jgi:hypothetical protein